MNRYLAASDGDTRTAMTLYRKNLILSQELFTVISCIEIALRNKIDRHYTSQLGNDWLRNGINGIFASEKTAGTRRLIIEVLQSLNKEYSHSRLVVGLGFGFWRFLFATSQFSAGGSSLLKIFPLKPKSNVTTQYNHATVFDYLAKINELRNRIAHHEPICFVPKKSIKSTEYARRNYRLILELFQWMDINEKSLMFAIDHVLTLCDEIDSLSPKSTSPPSSL